MVQTFGSLIPNTSTFSMRRTRRQSGETNRNFRVSYEELFPYSRRWPVRFGE